MKTLEGARALEDARYGKHSIYNSLVRAKAEGNYPALSREIIDTGRYLRMAGGSDAEDGG